jgi:ABC-type uncharacterized transport system substrate-binding protein
LVDTILKGANPTTWRSSSGRSSSLFNLKTAKSLGLTIPQSSKCVPTG